MKTVGIIAEFNPFHKGHAYLIREAKHLTGASNAVVIMSGDYVQRGEPAIVDKFTRTQMALSGGADVVLELPCAYATGSAEYFAGMAVRLLNALGCIDVLCFGCEDADTDAFHEMADLLSDEPEAFRMQLRQLLSDGRTYPQAREEALLAMSRSGELSIPEMSIHRLLSSPNNILALEYIRALHQTGSPIKAFPILRQGEGYHSLTLNAPVVSASAIRMALTAGRVESRSDADRTDGASYLDLVSHMGAESAGLLRQALSQQPCRPDDRYSTYLQYKLWEEREHLEDYLDVTPDLANRIRREAFQGIMDRDALVQAVRSRQLTEARVRRALLHIFLGVRQEDTEQWRKTPSAWYVRLLGFRRDSSEVLHDIKKQSRIPLISKMAGADAQLSPQGTAMLKLDNRSSDLYAFLEGRDDFDGWDVRRKIVVL